MSMIGTLLAFVVFPLKAKPKPKPIDAWLDREIERLKASAETTTFALDHWRNAYAHLSRETERLRQERDAARTVSLQLMDECDALRREIRLSNRLERVPSPQEQTQQARQLAQYHQQAQAILAQDFCNCVPSREQALYQPGHIFRQSD